MKNSNKLTKLFGRLGGTTTDRGTLSQLLSPTKSSSLATPIPSSRLMNSGAPADLRRVPLSATGIAKGINFGSPSSDRSTNSQGTSEWASLLKQTTSGGISSALGGGLLSAIDGLGGLVSNLAELFGGGTKTEAPLTRFHLPDPQSANVFATASESRAEAAATRTGGAYRTYSDSSTQVAHEQLSSAQITQVVKHALLNSSSLNDVIAEI